MKINDTDPNICVITLEDPNAYGAFKAGLIDHRQWVRHPETNELATYVNDNRRFSNIAVQVGDTFIKL